MKPNTPMEAALQRWCRENDIVPGMLVRSAFQGGWEAQGTGCIPQPDGLSLTGTTITMEYGSREDVERAIDEIERLVFDPALTTNQGQKEQADGS